MNDIDTLHHDVGEILMYCQCIEHDIKCIYAFMADGGFERNMIKMDEERWTLGQTLHELKQYDQSWDHPFFSEEDYATLEEITRKRNYYAHTVYLRFSYLSEEADFERIFAKVCLEAKQDDDLLSSLYERVEDARRLYLKDAPEARY